MKGPLYLTRKHFYHKDGETQRTPPPISPPKAEGNLEHEGEDGPLYSLRQRREEILKMKEKIGKHFTAKTGRRKRRSPLSTLQRRKEISDLKEKMAPSISPPKAEGNLEDQGVSF